MTEMIHRIMDNVDNKKVQSLCKKILKKCSFKSSEDMNNLMNLTLWLYVYGYYEEAVCMVEIIKDVQFSGNYTLWDKLDSIYCIKARIIRERGAIREAQEIIEFVNRYRVPELYKNLIKWFNETLELNIQDAIENTHSKSDEYFWRMVKLNHAIRFREAGQFPIPDEELERIIREQMEVLSKVK